MPCLHDEASSMSSHHVLSWWLSIRISVSIWYRYDILQNIAILIQEQDVNIEEGSTFYLDNKAVFWGELILRL